MDLKIKENIRLTDLEKLGFEEHTFGLYGPGDYIPSHWYTKNYKYKNKDFYIRTNDRFLFDNNDTLINISLYKETNTKRDKKIPFRWWSKISNIVLKDLLEIGILEKVKGENK